MSRAVLSVAWAGPHVTVQDAGRPGFQRFGVPASGPMDRLAFAAANLALGNSAGAAGIEVSPGGLVLDCLKGAVGFAVAGGGFVVEHDGIRRGSWHVAVLRAGQRLAIRRGHWGNWACLAFAGRLDAPEWLGSRATHALSNLGGGRLEKGATILIEGAQTREDRQGPIPCPVIARPRALMRVVPGPQERFFDAAPLAAFGDGPWRLTETFDRMGTRLAGPTIRPSGPLDMLSEPVMRGSVQVAGDGVATVLMADHQTTGGYPRIATVLDCDLDTFAQLRAGDPVAFRAVTPGEAVAAARTRANAVEGYLRSLARGA